MMSDKKMFSLNQEDDYNDGDYSDYEVMDYSEDEDDIDSRDEKGMNDSMYNDGKVHSRSTLRNDDDVIINLYNATIPVDTDAQARKRYSRIAYIMNHGTPKEKRAAGEEACLHMKGLVKDFIRKYRNYLQRDPDFAEDLTQEAYVNIIKYAGRYRADLGAPSTFFYYYINSAVSSLTTKMKHSISYSDATLKKKILLLKKQYKEDGRELTDADIVIETDESLSKIHSILQMMGRDMNTHLEAIQDYGEFIAGDPETNGSFESPETVAIKNKNYEDIIAIMIQKYGEADVELFIECKVNGTPYKTMAERSNGRLTEDGIRRKIDEMTHSFQYDPRIRRYGKGYIPEDKSSLVGISIIQMDSANNEMDQIEQSLDFAV